MAQMDYMKITYAMLDQMNKDGMPPSSVLVMGQIAHWATYLQEKGHPADTSILPYVTNVQLQEVVGLSSPQISNLLKTLTDKGYIKPISVGASRNFGNGMRRFAITHPAVLDSLGLINMKKFVETKLKNYEGQTRKYARNIDEGFFTQMNDTSVPFTEFSLRLDKIDYVTKHFIYVFTNAINEKFDGLQLVWDSKGKTFGKLKPMFKKMNMIPLTEEQIREFSNSLEKDDFDDLKWLTKLQEYYILNAR